jgi:hypothetical protein
VSGARSTHGRERKCMYNFSRKISKEEVTWEDNIKMNPNEIECELN